MSFHFTSQCTVFNAHCTVSTVHSSHSPSWRKLVWSVCSQIWLCLPSPSWAKDVDVIISIVSSPLLSSSCCLLFFSSSHLLWGKCLPCFGDENVHMCYQRSSTVGRLTIIKWPMVLAPITIVTIITKITMVIILGSHQFDRWGTFHGQRSLFP